MISSDWSRWGLDLLPPHLEVRLKNFNFFVAKKLQDDSFWLDLCRYWSCFLCLSKDEFAIEVSTSDVIDPAFFPGIAWLVVYSIDRSSSLGDGAIEYQIIEFHLKDDRLVAVDKYPRCVGFYSDGEPFIQLCSGNASVAGAILQLMPIILDQQLRLAGLARTFPNLNVTFGRSRG